jgi:hypothetical protein
VVLAEEYDGPGSGLDGTLPTGDMSTEATAEEATAEEATVDKASQDTASTPLPSPVITAGSDDPRCVN